MASPNNRHMEPNFSVHLTDEDRAILKAIAQRLKADMGAPDTMSNAFRFCLRQQAAVLGLRSVNIRPRGRGRKRGSN